MRSKERIIWLLVVIMCISFIFLNNHENETSQKITPNILTEQIPSENTNLSTNLTPQQSSKLNEKTDTPIKEPITIKELSTQPEPTQEVLDTTSESEDLWIKMFYFDHQVNYWLVKEISVNSLNPQHVLDTIIADPDFSAKSFIPHAEITVEEGTAFVNLPSDKLNVNNPPSDFSVHSMLELITNTLCVNFDLNIDNVQFLLDGEIRHIIGSSSTSYPWTMNPKWSDVYKN